MVKAKRGEVNALTCISDIVNKVYSVTVLVEPMDGEDLLTSSFVSWLTYHGGYIDLSAMGITTFPGHGRGAIALTDIAVGFSCKGQVFVTFLLVYRFRKATHSS